MSSSPKDSTADSAGVVLTGIANSPCAEASCCSGNSSRPTAAWSGRWPEAGEYERALHSQAVLAREMYDVVSRRVSLIAVRAGALQASTGDDDPRGSARTVRSLSVTTLDELHAMVRLLRASSVRDTELTPQSTFADLHRLVDASDIDTRLTGEPTSIDPTVLAEYATDHRIDGSGPSSPDASHCIPPPRPPRVHRP